MCCAAHQKSSSGFFQVICNYLVKQADEAKPGSTKSYPHWKKLRYVASWDAGVAPWQKPRIFKRVEPAPAVKLPPAAATTTGGAGTGAETPVWVVRRWYKDVTSSMILVRFLHIVLLNVAVGQFAPCSFSPILMRSRVAVQHCFPFC